MVAGGRELIDTLWNVNSICSSSLGVSVSELIDTLWNVNQTFTKKMRGATMN